jgi:small subunit ribosomal protein S20
MPKTALHRELPFLVDLRLPCGSIPVCLYGIFLCSVWSDNYMANHKSAAKKARHDAVARLRNRSNRSAMKTAIKRLLSVVSTGDKVAASALLPKTLGIVDKACRKGVLHKNAANRRKSRLTLKVNALA